MESEAEIIRALHGGTLDVARARAGADPAWARAIGAFAALYDLAPARAPDDLAPDDPAPDPAPAPTSVTPGEGAGTAAAQRAVAGALLHLASLGEAPAPGGIGDGGWLSFATGVARWVAGAVPVAPPELARDDPALRVAQMVSRALSTLAGGDLDAATQHARQATRAAYAEGLRGLEYLAYWTLARVRRASGNPYAAARILGALARAAPAAWRPLVDWELALAGGDGRAVERELSEPAATWLRLCRAAEAGDEGALRVERDRLRARRLAPRFALERDALCAGLSTGGAVDLAAQRAVAGALHESAERLGRTPAVWSVEPGAPPRLLWCVAARGAAEPRLFDEGDRVRTLVAALARAGAAGVDRVALFEEVYGFAFDPAVHDGVFRVLLHRVRGAFGERLELAREGDRLALVARAATLLPEPRSEPPFGDRILRLIATAPGASAKELAERAGTTVRGVQRALRLLLDTGACRAERAGRRVVYAVEDTTFSEPTHFGAGS